LGWVDEDGYVFITGRIKDVIVTGAGKNVYPGDLESIYANILGVQEIAVVGLRSGLTEDLHAVLVPRLDPDDDLAEIKKRMQRDIATLGRELPSYHRLQVVHVWREALPRTPAGSIDRAAVRAVLEAQAALQSPGVVATADATQEEPLLETLARLSGRPLQELRPEHDLGTDLGLDSLEAIEVLLFVESHYGIAVPDAAAERVRTVADALQLLRLQPPGSNGRTPRPLPSELTHEARPGFDRALHRASLRSVGALYRGYFGLRTPNANGSFPRNTPYILAANHASHLDLGAILTALAGAAGSGEAERLHVLGARDYFFDHWYKTWLVPIRRDRTGVDGLRAAKTILASGEPVLIFPEATRSRTGRLQAFKPGLGLLALEAQVPIVPAYIHGTYEALPAGRFMPRRTQLTVRFGAPITIQRTAGLVNKEEHVRHIADDVRRAIESLARDLDAPA
jgi:long-chain acyl-CoA synthetase